MQKFIRVALAIPLYTCFDYMLGEGMDLNDCKIGARVLVPFRGREQVGVIYAICDSTNLSPKRIKAIKQILDPEPILPKNILQQLTWAADYYHYPIGEVIVGSLPTLLRQAQAAKLSEIDFWRLTPKATAQSPADLKRAKKQLELFTYMQDLPEKKISNSKIIELFSRAAISGLEQKAYIEKFSEAVTLDVVATEPEAKLHLNTEQQIALDSISESLGGFKTFLLNGITGSGKTEVYLQLIEKVIQRGEQALVLVPEIGLTPQTLQRFQKRFPVPIAIFHSGLNNRERLNAWLLAKQGIAKVIIGTRSVLFTPLQKLGAIIVDECHDVSFKQQDGFRYNARDLSILRGSIDKVPVVLGTATPSIESLHNINNGRYQSLTLSQRAGNSVAAKYKIIDIRDEKLDEGLSDQVISGIKQHLAEKNQVLVFLNRRGYAPALMCHHCSWVANCKRCDARMTLHLSPRYLHCHHCDARSYPTKQCPCCLHNSLTPIGIGTERLETVFQRLLPDTQVIRIDRDSIRRKQAMDQALEKIHGGESQILIGTQMLAKGHHFPNVTLVVILDADGGFFSADFRAAERTAQLILQVAGRAGRAEKPGEVWIQTRNPKHPQLLKLIDSGYQEFANEIYAERKLANLPPFAFLALLRVEANQKDLLINFLQDVRKAAEANIQDQVNLFGPIPAPMEKRQGRYRFQLLVQANKRNSLQHALDPLIKIISKDQRSRKVRWSLDVDPQDMF